MRYASAAEPARKPRNRGREGHVDGLLTVGVVETGLAARVEPSRSLRTPQSSKRPSQRISTSSKKYHRAGSTAPVEIDFLHFLGGQAPDSRSTDRTINFFEAPVTELLIGATAVALANGINVNVELNAVAYARAVPRGDADARPFASCARRAWPCAATSPTRSSRKGSSTSRNPATDDDG